jgi:hypothetical protein
MGETATYLETAVEAKFDSLCASKCLRYGLGGYGSELGG